MTLKSFKNMLGLTGSSLIHPLVLIFSHLTFPEVVQHATTKVELLG